LPWWYTAGMTAEILTMSEKELDRAELMRRVHERRLTQRKAAEILGLSERQVQRMYRAYRTRGPAALISAKRGRASNRRLPEELQTQVLQLARARYADFGPTLAREKLLELHGLTVSVETLRRWMIADGLWTPRKQRDRRVQQPRRRRDCLGELVQIDGSDHEWFEQRAERCVLLVYIDDATGRLMELQFCRSESTFDYFCCTRRYLLNYGKPVAFYSDKASIFRVNKKQPRGGDGLTQFGRAMTDLNIDIICANTPAAKGRVERVNLTLQDRLVKELRLRDISAIDQANRFLPRFQEDFNRRFARQPANAYDAHRPLLPTDDLDDVFTWQEQRRVSKSLTLNYKNVMYLLEPTDRARELRGKCVTVHETEDGRVSIRQGALPLPAAAFPRDRARVTQGAIVENKLLGAVLSEIRDRQLARDADALRSNKVTLREKERIRQQMREAVR
jgi:transposase